MGSDFQVPSIKVVTSIGHTTEEMEQEEITTLLATMEVFIINILKILKV
jgi:hypothetical protein